MITSDGKNKLNLEMRKNKLQYSTRSINTTASTDVMRRIEIKVILDLHEKINIPSLLVNSESWTLSKTEENQIDQIEIQTLKNLLSLPTATPSVAVVFSLGVLYASCRVDQTQFMYLHKVLMKNDKH